MRSKTFPATTNQKPCTAYSTRKALLKKTENLFLVNSALDDHTAASTGIATNNRILREYIVKVNDLIYIWSQCEISKYSIFLNHVLVGATHNILSPGCLVKSGYEIKLSKNNSFISKNGEEMLSVSFQESNWVVDINPPQPKGFVKDVKPKSTEKINLILEKELDKALDKALSKKTGNRREMFKSDVECQKRKIFRHHHNTRIKNHLEANAGNVSWILNSYCPFHSINTKQNLINIRSWEGKDERGKPQWVGDYMIGNLLLKDVRYIPADSCNNLSLNRLAEEGFETYLTNQNATITKHDVVFLTAPMVGKLWIANSLHEQNGWLENGCPYEIQDRIKFEARYGNKFTKEEIEQAFDEMTHDCELGGPRQTVRVKL